MDAIILCQPRIEVPQGRHLPVAILDHMKASGMDLVLSRRPCLGTHWTLASADNTDWRNVLIYSDDSKSQARSGADTGASQQATKAALVAFLLCQPNSHLNFVPWCK